MKFAYIKLVKTSEKKIVETENIIDFDTYADNPSNKEVYLLHENNRKKSCVILITGETKVEIENFLKYKRVPDPKINDSDRIDDILDPEDGSNDENDEDKSDGDEDDKNESDKDEEEAARVQRKKFQTNRAAAKRQTAEDIINTHKKARATTNIDIDMTIENDDPELLHSRSDIQSSAVLCPPSTSRSDIGSSAALCAPSTSRSDIGSSAALCAPSTSRSPMSEILEPNQTHSRVDNPQIGTIKDGLIFLGDGEWRAERELSVGMKRQGLIYLGEKVWIKENAFKTANNTMRPSLFVTTLAYGIWGYDELSNRCVAQIAGKEVRPILEDNKVLALTNAFERYLKKRGCDKITYTCEVNNINAYLGRAIGNARKKIKASKNTAHSRINN